MQEDLHVHYENAKAVLVAKSLFRDLWVSHWGGQLSVEEHYELHNEGAKYAVLATFICLFVLNCVSFRLKDHFSRVEFAYTAASRDQFNVVESLTLTFPPHATNAFYRDTIGNVSTSKFRNERTRSVMEIKPRYPLWGGWRYTWYHGYDIPLSAYLRSSGTTYTLKVPFVGGLTDVSIETATVRVVLPESARYVQGNICQN
jgi:oligosaccharyltransferase complex subunit alpha (ribophorin I)